MITQTLLSHAGVPTFETLSLNPNRRIDMAMFSSSRLPLLSLPRFNMSRLILAVTFSALAAVRLACSLKVSFPSNNNPKYFRAVQNLICSPFRQKEEVLNQRRCLNSSASVFVVARLSLAGRS